MEQSNLQAFNNTTRQAVVTTHTSAHQNSSFHIAVDEKYRLAPLKARACLFLFPSGGCGCCFSGCELKPKPRSMSSNVVLAAAGFSEGRLLAGCLRAAVRVADGGLVVYWAVYRRPRGGAARRLVGIVGGRGG